MIKGQAPFHAEKEALYQAGLASSPWQHLDDTSTRVNGQNGYCHIVCNPLYTAYVTTAAKDRLTIIDVLTNQRPRRFLVNAEALDCVEAFGLSAVRRRQLGQLPSGTIVDEATMHALLEAHLPSHVDSWRKRIWQNLCDLLPFGRARAEQIPSIVFDYGQGFATGASPRHFIEYAKPIEIKASHEGVAINPLQLFPSDVHGPVNVAQRVADTFQRVYAQIGVQQHAILRQAVLDVMSDEGIVPENRTSWDHSPPPFAALQHKLHSYAENPSHPQRRIASSVASHISTMFVFNTFQDNGLSLDWQDMLDSRGSCVCYPTEGARTLAGTSGHRVSFVESHWVCGIDWSRFGALFCGPG